MLSGSPAEARGKRPYPGPEGSAEDRQERTMSVRQRQEIQKVLRRMNA
jgi:hypothetical protein